MTFLEQRQVSFARNIIRPVAEHLHNDSGGTEHCTTVRNDPGSLLDIGGIGIAGLLACARFDDHLEPGFCEIRNHNRYDRDATLSGVTFFRNSDNHLGSRPFRQIGNSSCAGS